MYTSDRPSLFDAPTHRSGHVSRLKSAKFNGQALYPPHASSSEQTLSVNVPSGLARYSGLPLGVVPIWKLSEMYMSQSPSRSMSPTSAPIAAQASRPSQGWSDGTWSSNATPPKL